MRYDNDFLIHYGVPGMKWGVRNYQNTDGSLTKAGRKRYNISMGKKPVKEQLKSKLFAIQKKMDSKKQSPEDIRKEKLKAENKLKKKDVSELTDEELKARVNRLNLEAQAKRLSNELNPPKPKKEHKLRKAIAAEASNALKNVLVKPLVQALSVKARQQYDKALSNFIEEKKLEKAYSGYLSKHEKGFYISKHEKTGNSDYRAEHQSSRNESGSMSRQDKKKEKRELDDRMKRNIIDSDPRVLQSGHTMKREDKIISSLMTQSLSALSSAKSGGREREHQLIGADFIQGLARSNAANAAYVSRHEKKDENNNTPRRKRRS